MVAVVSLAIVHESSAVVGEVAVTNRFVGGMREGSIATAVVFADETVPPVVTIASITLTLPAVTGR
jgi:hypothetical protein